MNGSHVLAYVLGYAVASAVALFLSRQRRGKAVSARIRLRSVRAGLGAALLLAEHAENPNVGRPTTLAARLRRLDGDIRQVIEGLR